MFNAVEWFANHGNMSFANELEHLRGEYYDNYDSEDSRKLITAEMEKVRASARDRYEDLRSDWDF